jgi:hypothetical protein
VFEFTQSEERQLLVRALSWGESHTWLRMEAWSSRRWKGWSCYVYERSQQVPSQVHASASLAITCPRFGSEQSQERTISLLSLGETNLLLDGHMKVSAEGSSMAHHQRALSQSWPDAFDVATPNLWVLIQHVPGVLETFWDHFLVNSWQGCHTKVSSDLV